MSNTTNGICLECGKNIVSVEVDRRKKTILNLEDYMVHDYVWGQAVPERQGKLHLECLAKRLGRALRIEDFAPEYSNFLIRFGYNMAIQDFHREMEAMED